MISVFGHFKVCMFQMIISAKTPKRMALLLFHTLPLQALQLLNQCTYSHQFSTISRFFDRQRRRSVERIPVEETIPVSIVAFLRHFFVAFRFSLQFCCVQCGLPYNAKVPLPRISSEPNRQTRSKLFGLLTMRSSPFEILTKTSIKLFSLAFS